MDLDEFGLTETELEILYNIQRLKTLNDINLTKVVLKNDSQKRLKMEWVTEWQYFMEVGFPAFVNNPQAVLQWYSQEELLEKLHNTDCSGVWLKLVLLEAMLFEPYYVLSIEKGKKGKDVPSTKYKSLNNPITGYNQKDGDKYLETVFSREFFGVGLINRFRKCYRDVKNELTEVLKTALVSVSIAALITAVIVATAGAFAPKIAVLLVGTKFAGLSGAALTSACLAYLGGGAIAAGGGGMAADTVVLGAITATATVGLAVVAVGTLASHFYSKKNTEAEAYLAEVKLWAEQMQANWVVLAGVKKRINELYEVTIDLAERCKCELDKLERIIPVFDNSNSEHVKCFQQCALMAKSVSELAITPVLDEEGNISQQSGVMVAKTQKILNSEL
jgi:hypothetical protein